MPRFIARPISVEAYRFEGNIVLWPDEFRFVVTRHFGDGTISIATGDGARVCRYGDWVINGPNGFEVVHAAPFEAMFAEAVPVVPTPDPDASKRPARKVAA